MGNFKTDYDKAIEKLERQIQYHELDYADNYRAYRKEDCKGFSQFKEKEKQGCCGVYEGSVTVHGDTWIVACNYGH